MTNSLGRVVSRFRYYTQYLLWIEIVIYPVSYIFEYL